MTSPLEKESPLMTPNVEPAVVTLTPVNVDQFEQAAIKASAEKRVNIHAHISGLGLDGKDEAIAIASGFVGQKNAREVTESF